MQGVRFKGMAMWVALAMVGAMAMATTQAAGNAKGPLDLFVRADLVIAADGTLTALHWDEKRPPVLALLRQLEPKVRQMTFEPGQVDGTPAETRTSLLMKLGVDESADGAIRVDIASARTGARMDTMTPPVYPASALRSGAEASLVAIVEAGPDGAVDVLELRYAGNRTSAGNEKLFRKAAEEAIRQWTFRSEQVDGHPVAARLSVPISFCQSASRWCDEQKKRTATADVPPDMPVALDSVAKVRTPPAASDI